MQLMACAIIAGEHLNKHEDNVNRLTALIKYK